ncbi:fatty acid--CoA ligase family protein [Xenorhabdus sp. PR6a]|uniref:class I adenylate-forming enzyme family protein n=1 Tax=Xenorhabdus sp. PR6a TaxID=3025877 RepID=UPI00235A3900|nr:fatty acid--CoA ligase family protein [Xenorhabdus sp. PR6a]MDC9581605.1 fatty acid--CoA ligase family protein [Xenorhabdus sp. PR6a]
MVHLPATLDATLRLNAKSFPLRIVLTDAQNIQSVKNYNWGETNAIVDTLAWQFTSLPGSGIGVLLDNSYHCLCLIYGVVRAGKDLILIDPEWGVAAKRAIIKEMSLQTLLSTEPINDQFATLQFFPDFSSHFISPFSKTAATTSRMIVFTSGTTGKPKGIILSQKAMVNAYSIGRRCLGIGKHTRVGCFYRVSGLGILGINFLFPLLYGGSVVLLPRHCWTDNEHFWHYIEYFSITFLYLVPPIVNFMVKEGIPPANRLPLEQLLCVSGSARLDVGLQAEFQCRFAPLANIYGLSECGFAFLFGRRHGEDFDNSVGPAVGLSLRLIDEQGQEIHTPNVPGRLWVRTPSLFSGYVNQPALTSQVVRDGWLDTQDIAFFDKQKGFYVVGRVDGTVNKGGNLFHLSECEQLLNTRDDVADVCCLKVPCELYGEDYIAVIQGAPFKTTELINWLNLHLGVQRAPRTVICLEEKLPLNGAGKHDRYAIMNLISQRVT